MQIRCYHCQKPYALGKDAMHAALDLITTENLSHYDAPVPALPAGKPRFS